MRFLLVVLALAACGDDSNPTPPPVPSKAPASGNFQSGSRLRAHYWDAGGGATVLQDWHDSTLGISCQFNLAEDGAWRCLPDRDSAFQFSSPLNLFLDGNCTDLAVDSQLRTVPAWATVTDQVCAGEVPTAHVYQIGTQVIAPGMIYMRSGSTCTGMPPTAGHYLFALTPADPTLFAAAQIVVENRGGLDIEVLVGDDDTRQLGRILDHKRGKSCQAEMVDGRCLPEDVGTELTNNYTTADCSGSGHGSWQCTTTSPHCPAPTLALGTTMAGCTDSHDLVAIGSPVAQSYSKDSNGQCMPIVIGGGCMFSPAIGPVDFATFPAIGTASLGTGRVNKQVLAAPGENRELADLGLFDTQRNAPCGISEFSDNIRRCVSGTKPINDFGLVWYSDASCTLPLVGGSSDACTPDPTYAIRLYQSGNVIYAAVIDKLYSIGAPFTGTTAYQVDGPTGQCMAANRPGPMWTLGAQLDPDTIFARVTEHTD